MGSEFGGSSFLLSGVQMSFLSFRLQGRVVSDRQAEWMWVMQSVRAVSTSSHQCAVPGGVAFAGQIAPLLLCLPPRLKVTSVTATSGSVK